MTNIPEGRILWTPNSKDTEIDKFRRQINRKYGLSLDDYWDLHQWSITHISEFWKEVWQYTGVIHSTPYKKVLDTSTKFEDIPKWFEGATLNFAENFLRFRDDRVALYYTEEGMKDVEEVTYAELYENVRIYAAALKRCGVKAGDVVAGYITTSPAAVYATFSATSIGALWTCAPLDFGVGGTLDRFRIVKPKIIFSIDSSVNGGEKINYLTKLKPIVEGLPSVEKIIIVQKGATDKEILEVPKSYILSEFLAMGKNEDGSIPPLEFAQLPFSHPVYIFFTSGTSGLPKGVVHSAGGVLVENLKSRVLHTNACRDDVVGMFSSVGWGAWQILLSYLCVGSSIVLYVGSPFYPHSAAMWDLVDRFKISMLTLYPCYIDTLEKDGVKPKYTHKLEKLHTVISTACVAKRQNWEYFYREVKPDIYFLSSIGATELFDYVACTNYTLPLRLGEMPSPDLGFALECWDSSGKPVIGKQGEFVITKPFPSMPLCFLNDPNKEIYKKTFFEKFPGVWSQNDICLFHPVTKGLIMYGRSDGVLNPQGVRFCSSELYTIVEDFPEVLDSLCVSQTNKAGEERVVLFLKIAPGHCFSQELVKKITEKIGTELLKYFEPEVILEVKDIPYSITKKKAESAVKNVIANKEVPNKSVLINPEALNYFANIPELQGF